MKRIAFYPNIVEVTYEYIIVMLSAIYNKIAVYFYYLREISTSLIASFMENMGVILRDIRQQRKLSLVQLGQIANLSKPYLSEIETGKKAPNIEILNRICTALDVPLEYVVLQSLKQKANHNALLKELLPHLEKVVDLLPSKQEDKPDSPIHPAQ